MPDDQPGSSDISLRVPNDLIDAFDKLAEALDRPRCWVMVRALRHYLEQEGAEIFEDSESLAELDRGEKVFPAKLHRRQIIERAEKTRAPGE